MEADESTRFVSLSYLERELGPLTEEQRDEVEKELLAFIGKLRALILGSPCLYGSEDVLSHPNCATCILSPTSDSLPRFLSAAYSLLSSLVDAGIFFRHSYQPEWRLSVVDRRHLELCTGFRPLVEAYLFEARQIALKTSYLISTIVPQEKKKATH